MPAPAPAATEEDWFGEGSAFDSGEDLAAALYALAGVGPAPAMPADDAHPAADIVIGGGDFEVVERGPVTTPVATGLRVLEPAAPPAPTPYTWSIRAPGRSLLPPRQSGRSGWSIRSSVTVLHRTEEAMAKLREEAVESAFLAAATAMAQGRAPRAA